MDITKLKGRGRSLYLAVSNSKYTNKEDAELIGYKENTFYQHIKQEFLDYKIMVKYATALKHEFSIEYPEIMEYQIEDPSDRIAKESKPYLDLHQKYTSLLENNNQLLLEYNKTKDDLVLLQQQIAVLEKEIKTLKVKK